ncbi:carotenoid ester lipase precursor [Panaeolus papilionaceus]|nr:carotenoid ester lipase precursor [Panaeolus papilionaceus]
MITNLGINAIFPFDEDCLTINVVTPTIATPSSKLPVVLWIYGGGFERGTASFPLYDGGVIVERSILLGTPVIYASINYRLTGFGFLGGKEVKAAGIGNLGLQDQRQAMRWIQKYIGAFGGDPTKVTIWGESAGSISVALHLVANSGNPEGLFRGAFMQSGATLPFGAIDSPGAQAQYDDLVSRTGCKGSSDTLSCLRSLPFDVLKAGVDQSPGIFDFQSLNLAWPPRADGVFITDSPQKLVQNGVIANVPFVIGDCDDEGTLFSFSTLNVTTEAQFQTYIQKTLLPGMQLSSAEISQIAKLYPSDLTQGSPYDTGVTDALTPQYKRLASFQGDLIFQAPRRWLLQNRSGKQTAFAFRKSLFLPMQYLKKLILRDTITVSKRFKTEPILGSMHVTDLLNIYGGQELTNYLVRFVNTLNPNGFGNFVWPQYTPKNPQLLTFLDGFIPTTITTDDFRSDGINLINNLTLAHPL